MRNCFRVRRYSIFGESSMEIESASVSATATEITRPLVVSRPSRKISLAGIRPWTWFVIDYAIAYASATLAFTMTPHALYIGGLDNEHVGQAGFCFGLALLVALVAHIAGLHELNQRRQSFGLLARCFMVSLAAVVIINAELLFVHYMKVGRLITIFTLVGCTGGLFLFRALIVGFVVRNNFIAAIVGSREYIDRALESLGTSEAHGVKIVTLDLNERPGTSIREWALQNGVDQVVVDTDDPLVPDENELLKLIDGRLKVSTYTGFVENLFERVPSQHITAQWIIDAQAEHASLYTNALKRILDVVVSSIALILLSPLVAIAALVIRLESPGAVIFRQTRVGQHGQLFTMLKLRSMRADAEKDGACWATEGDTRVTRIGQFLRNSRLDEAPQLLNVIAGQMSLVGPRPERPEFTEKLESSIPFFVHRLMVKPGITGWAQINAAYAASEADSQEKLSFDLYYVKMLSFAMDLRILLRTISSFMKGAR